MNKYLVVFVEGERIAKERFEELHGLYSDFENERGEFFQILEQGFDAVDRHWNVLNIIIIYLVSVFDFELLVISGDKTEKIGRKKLSLGEQRHYSFLFIQELFQ